MNLTNRVLPALLLTQLWACAEQIDWVAISAHRDASVTSCDDVAAVPAPAACERIADTLSRPLCTCEDFTASDTLTIRSISTNGPRAHLGTHIDGALSLSASADILGSLTVGADNGISLAPGHRVDVSQNLEVGGGLAATGSDIYIGDNARVAGHISARSLRVGGILTRPSTVTVSTELPPEINATLSQDVQVAPACVCTATAPPRNEAPFADPQIESSVNVCGARRTHGLVTDGNFTIRGSGTLFVEGDVNIGGALKFAPHSETDLYVWIAGNLTVQDELETQTDFETARVHLLIAGGGTLQIGGGTFRGSITAPNAELLVSAPLEVTGAILVRRANITAGLTILHTAEPLECSAP